MTTAAWMSRRVIATPPRVIPITVQLCPPGEPAALNFVSPTPELELEKAPGMVGEVQFLRQEVQLVSGGGHEEVSGGIVTTLGLSV